MTQWRDIKGNAKWDFIKWGIAGCLMIPAGLAAFAGFVRHAPFWEVLIVFTVTAVVTFAFFAGLFYLFSKLSNRKEIPNPTSDFEIEGVPLDIATAQYHICQIRIYNKNPNKTADNVRVELVALEDAAISGTADDYFRPLLPVILKPEIAGENTINPGASQKYNLFRVTMNVKSAILKDGNVIGWQQKFLAYFTQETTKNVTQFIWKESYRLKLAVTARDFAKVEQEFNLTFSDEGKSCRFTLTKINGKEIKFDEGNKVKAEKAVEKLTEFGAIFLQRISAINGIDPNKYNPEKDDETWNANSAVIAYILYNLNQDAAKVYDEGVSEINTYSVRLPGVGSTRFEDDYRVVLARLNRRFVNIKRIVDEIDKYLK